MLPAWMFQFQCGAIVRPDSIVEGELTFGFNSSVVRLLEHLNVREATGDNEFQFQCGAIVSTN